MTTLPQIDEDYKKVLRITGLIRMIAITAVPLIIMIVIYSIIGYDLFVIVFLGIFFALVAFSIFMVIWYPTVWYNNFSFELDQSGVKINSGVITKNERFIPYDRIQDLTIQSGYFDRRYGLSSIFIETAGSSPSYQGRYYRPEGVIPGLRNPQPIVDEIKAKMGK